jgi:diadenosine tetraphosphate (Ap4A) HIT family hydrolase
MRTLKEAQEQGIIPWERQTVDLGSVKVFADKYPVTTGHRLFVPANNDSDNIAECFQQAYKLGKYMVESGFCDGFNVGMNMGESAGQTVMYPHVHLIPRRQDDTKDPVGGVRAVVSGQANYRSPEYQPPSAQEKNSMAALDPSQFLYHKGENNDNKDRTSQRRKYWLRMWS